MLQRVLSFVYGVAVYGIFLGTFVYAIGFIGNVFVPKSLDSEPGGALGSAVAINLLLLGVFAIQHSVMARPTFKARWTRVIPTVIERSTYVLFSSAALILLFWQWRPMGGVLWNVEDTLGRAALYGVYGFGWLLVLVATFLIDHFDLFGLRQVWLHLRRKPYTQHRFVTPGPYQWVRHPLYVGWIIVFWAAPTMTVAHLLFAIMTTAYILVAIQFEERNLIEIHGKDYLRYRKRVPMLVPFSRRIRGSGTSSEPAAVEA